MGHLDSDKGENCRRSILFVSYFSWIEGEGAALILNCKAGLLASISISHSVLIILTIN